MKKAYDNWMYVIEYDGKALVNPKSKKKAASTSQAEARAPPAYAQRISSTSIAGPSPAGEAALKCLDKVLDILVQNWDACGLI